MIRIQTEKRLDTLTTFGLRSTAEAFAQASSIEDLQEAAAVARERGWKLHLLGGGSNTVLMSRVPGLVLQPVFRGIRRETDASGSVLVVAGAAEALDDVVGATLQHGLGGLENLAAIPGSVGGAIVQNASAYGLEIAERLAWCRAWDRETGEIRLLTTEDCDFGYRTSYFKSEEGRRLVIIEAAFRMPAEWKPEISYKGLGARFEGRAPESIRPEEVEAAVREIRASKLPDPAETGSAGSFFKNPVVTRIKARELITLHPKLVTYPLAGSRSKLAAGWLIEAAGLKGYAEETVGVWPAHALILVNRGGATGEDVLRFARGIAERVERRFGVTLEPEPVFVGTDEAF
ncbi:UDP-N-acetylmuramate dehydrogenase [Sutterella sp.]|uniref:UDP-N-acetylmuramate dehydrogenase n=1 Tax=Sutterella sp. TaxID=1981025 RepID=UPI0026DF6586|nr:UDP-N-acetylmuramate dehydrogenase [Sutterella sp.]MDO5531385.1 UDP-N-acetylmuramate dehydrogenase [Sutterella sp.]